MGIQITAVSKLLIFGHVHDSKTEEYINIERKQLTWVRNIKKLTNRSGITKLSNIIVDSKKWPPTFSSRLATEEEETRTLVSCILRKIYMQLNFWYS